MAKKGDRHQATLRDMLALEFPTNLRISPDGTKVAFTVQTTNWKDNRYESHCHLYDDLTGHIHPLTRSGSVDQMEWIDDGTLAVLKSDGEKGQVWLFERGGGEGWQVYEHKTGVEWFHPFAGGIVFLAREPEKDEKRRAAINTGNTPISNRRKAPPPCTLLAYKNSGSIKSSCAPPPKKKERNSSRRSWN